MLTVQCRIKYVHVYSNCESIISSLMHSC